MAVGVETPPELQDIIIDSMHSQKQVLGTCGLVSKAWLRSSRHHLFGSVALHQQNWPDFLCLAKSPLATSADSINSSDLQTGDDENFNKLAAGVPTFPGVRRLRLCGVYLSSSFALTDDSLLALFHNITELDHVSTFATPYQLALLVSHFTHLPEARATWFRFRPPSREVCSLSASAPQPATKISPLVASRCRAAAVNPRSRNEHSGNRQPPAAGAVVRALGTHLEGLDLKLIYRVTTAGISKYIDLSRNTRLQCFTIHTSLRRFLSPAAYAGDAHASWALLSALYAKITTLTIVLALDTVDLIDNFGWAFRSTAL
ncbi:hypothetical protein C8R44DRAFT_915786 [Mycena epipterygia]|nr:hypothetical protein C8R44DRAFT_915786 [Mycena epipterygia]